jgi:hypothetical protein
MSGISSFYRAISISLKWLTNENGRKRNPPPQLFENGGN